MSVPGDTGGFDVPAVVCRSASSPPPVEFVAEHLLGTLREVGTALRPIVEKIQDHLRHLAEQSTHDEVDYAVNAAGLYEALTQPPQGAAVPAEPMPSPDAFDRVTEMLMRRWDRGDQHWGSRRPVTLTALKQAQLDQSSAETLSPISFQGGPEYASARYVHVLPGRVMGKPREATVEKFYLYPRADGIGDVVTRLAELALVHETPMSFKFADMATGKPFDRAIDRADRIVLYVGQGQKGFARRAINDVVAANRAAFAGRVVPGVGEAFCDGVMRMDELTPAQKQKFKGVEDTSSGALRAHFLHRLTMDVARQTIVDPLQSRVRVGDATIRDRFVAHLSKRVAAAFPGTMMTAADPMLQAALRCDLDPERLEHAGFGPRARRMIEDAVNRTARDVLPRLRTDDLVRDYQARADVVAPEYGIDPRDLSRNAPMITEKASLV